MVINTKFEIGQSVWTILDGYITSIKITEIKVAVHEDNKPRIAYGWMGATTWYVKEESCFVDKETFKKHIDEL